MGNGRDTGHRPVLGRAIAALACVFVMTGSFPASGAVTEEGEYLPGGPLAGLKLPPDPREGVVEVSVPWREVRLYPDSVEHWRGYWLKYTPVRSFFDAQSQLKNWTGSDLANLGSVTAEGYSEPVYTLLRDSTGTNTGLRFKSVPVVRCTPGKPRFHLDLGTLDAGMYCLRIVGAVDTGQLHTWRDALYVNWKLNDGPRGEIRAYRRRLGYVDNFFSVEELYFHLGEQRAMHAEFSVGEGSLVDLFVSNVILDDALAGTKLRAFKKRRTLITDGEIAAIRRGFSAVDRQAMERDLAPTRAWTTEDRWARDEAIWKRLPPVQIQFWGSDHVDLRYEERTPVLTPALLDEKYGLWQDESADSKYGFTLDPKCYGNFLTNRLLQAGYRIDDLWALKPLPDPYPFPDLAGYYWTDSPATNRGYAVAPVIHAVWSQCLRHATRRAGAAATAWLRSGEEIFARDAAVALVRYAYNYPAYDYAQQIASFLKTPAYRDRDTRFRQRCGYDFTGSSEALRVYDMLFPYLQGNDDLARSIQRFVPWVKSSDDLVALLDTYLAQTAAKRILRYQDVTSATAILEPAICLGNPEITEPMIQWLFRRAFAYPLPIAGLQDLVICGFDRLGMPYLGSTYYAGTAASSVLAADLEKYRETVGRTEYDLSDPRQYPKPLAACYWGLDITVAGQDFLRIGDDAGPDRAPGYLLRAHLIKSGAMPRQGWKWSKDPKFAWIIRNMIGRTVETDAEWQAVETAAANIKRAPWLDQSSRVVANWAGILETGRPHDDYRFRRAAYVRAGSGFGDQHDDTLDLQVFAHGLSMTPDAGQHSGLSKPNSRFSRVHNVVEVDGGRNADEFGLRSHAWVRALSDANGARYLRTQALHPQSPVFYRQTSLIDVDEGSFGGAPDQRGSQPLSIDQQRPFAKLPDGVTTANSYVFDVFRVVGGRAHTWCFHGPLYDEFDWNATDCQPPEKDSDEAMYLGLFSATPETHTAGNAPETLVATWRYSRAGEKMQLGENYHETSPRAYTRLHLLGTGGQRALRADLDAAKLPGRLACLMVRQQGENLQSVFPAIIEPYRGAPFVVSARSLSVTNNETDARRAVAVEVVTTNGHTDVCFADGRPDKVRQVSLLRQAYGGQAGVSVQGGGSAAGKQFLDTRNLTPEIQIRISGEFAYLSTDTNGLRQASLTGGTLLESPAIQIAVSECERLGKVVRVDYPSKTLWIDSAWPAACAGRPFEIGNTGRFTSYTSATVAPEDRGTRIVVTEGADLYRSPVKSVVPGARRVNVALTSPGMTGLPRGWTASNEQVARTWKVIDAQETGFTLNEPVFDDNFEPARTIRLWEYGVGDTVRQPAFVSVRRLEDGSYEAQGDTDAVIALGGITNRISAADLEKGGGRVRLQTK